MSDKNDPLVAGVSVFTTSLVRTAQRFAETFKLTRFFVVIPREIHVVDERFASERQCLLDPFQMSISIN